MLFQTTQPIQQNNLQYFFLSSTSEYFSSPDSMEIIFNSELPGGLSARELFASDTQYFHLQSIISDATKIFHPLMATNLNSGL